MTLVTKKEISGFECEIHVNSYGRFTVLVEGTTLGADDTLEKAVNAARPKLAQRKVKVAIRFYTKAGEEGVATGLHASNGSVLVRIANQPAQVSDYKQRRVFRHDMPRDQLDRYLSLGDQIRAFSQEQATINKEYEIDILVVTQREVAAKAEATDNA